jgi:peroxiredoxin
MARVQVNRPAPDVELDDFNGQRWSLAQQWGKKHVILVFNRGFL